MNDSNEATSVSGDEENHHSSESLEGDLTISIFDGLPGCNLHQTSNLPNLPIKTHWVSDSMFVFPSWQFIDLRLFLAPCSEKQTFISPMRVRALEKTRSRTCTGALAG